MCARVCARVCVRAFSWPTTSSPFNFRLIKYAIIPQISRLIPCNCRSHTEPLCADTPPFPANTGQELACGLN